MLSFNTACSSLSTHLFPDELQLAASTTAATLHSLGCHLEVDLCRGVQEFFSGEAEGCLTVDIDSAVLEDCFWRVPPTSRPPTSGHWHEIAGAQEGCKLGFVEGVRVRLLDGWHNGDWPPGLHLSCDQSVCLKPTVQLCMLRLLHVLSYNWGWLCAPEDFWSNAIATPFLRFHHAIN